MNTLKHISQRIDEMLEDESLHICGDAGAELEEIQTWCYQAGQQRDAFIESVYELAFGDNAINREFTPDEVLARLREFSDMSLQVEDAQQEAYYIEFQGDSWQSVFKSHEGHLSQLHSTIDDAYNYMRIECGIVENITIVGSAS